MQRAERREAGVVSEERTWNGAGVGRRGVSKAGEGRRTIASAVLALAAVLAVGIPARAGVVENLVFGKKSHASQIAAEARFCGAEDIAAIFGNPGTFSFGDSSPGFTAPPGARVFLLLALQNNGNQRAWGVCEVHLPSLDRSVRVEVPDLSPNMERPAFYVTELTGIVVDVSAGGFPSASTSWAELHVK